MRGSVKIIETAYQFLAYGRFYKKEKMLMAFNNSHEAVERDVRVHDIGLRSGDVMIQILLTYEDGYSEDPVCHEVNRGAVSLTLPPKSAMVLLAKK